MKLLLVLSCVALAAAYTDLDDNVYGKLLDSRKSLDAFFKCLLDQGPCIGTFSSHAKTHMAEFFADGCNECDERQKHYSHLLIIILKSDYPEYYTAMQAKYDIKGNANNVQDKLKNL